MPKGKHLDGFGTIVDRIVKIVLDAVEIDSAGLNGIRRVGHFPNSWLPSNEVEGTLEVHRPVRPRHHVGCRATNQLLDGSDEQPFSRP